MPPTNRQRFMRYTAIVVVLAVVLAGVMYYLSNRGNGPERSEQPPASSTLHAPIGNGLAIDGKNPGAKAIKLNAQTPVQQSTLVRSQGSVSHITPEGPLRSPVTLRFTLDHPVDVKHRAVFIASRDSADDPWQFQPATVIDGGRVATVRVTHFSDWWPFDVNIDAMVKSFQDEVMNALTGGTYNAVDKPHCDNEDTAKTDGFEIKSSSTSTVYWCFGIEDGQRIVRVVNNRSYPLQLSHQNMSVKTMPAMQYDFRHLAQFGNTRTILMPGESVTYIVKATPAQKAWVRTEFSGYAQSLYNLDVAVESLITIFAKLGGKELKGAAVYRAMDMFMGFRDCGNDVKAKNYGGMFIHCFSGANMVKVFGLKAVLLAPLTAVGTIAAWFKSSTDGVIQMWTGEANYTIVITKSVVSPTVSLLKPYIGIWSSHTIGTEIKSDGTGELQWHGFKGSTRTDYTAQYKVSFPGGRATATITSSDVTTSAPETGYYAFTPGQQYTLDLQENGVLAFNALNGDGELLLCGNKAPVGFCGA